MPYVITRTFTRHHDKLSGVEFVPLLENGFWVGAAAVDAETAEQFEDRPGFEVITDAQYKDILVPPAAEPSAPSPSGDPLTDKAGQTGEPNVLEEAPEPPPSL